MRRVSKRNWDAPILVASAFGVALFCTLLNKQMFDFGHLTPWLVLDLAFESVLALFVYAFVPSIWRVLTFQAVLGIGFRAANSIKVRHLGVPLLASDLFEIKDLYRLLPGFGKLLLVFGLVVFAMALLALLLPAISLPRGRRWVYLLPAAAIGGWIGMLPSGFNAWVDGLMARPGTPFLITEREETIGVPLSFSVEASRYLELRGAIPRRDEVDGALKFFANGAPLMQAASPQLASPGTHGKRPNIYIFLIETFWDPATVLKQYGVPYLAPEFRWLWAKNGRHWMVSPTYGGGTANVEFELLCGFPSRAVSRGIAFEDGITNPMPCLPRMLKDRGYKTLAFHPYLGTFYNRKAAFPLLGFDRFYTIDDYLPGAVPGAFLDDATFLHDSLAIARKQTESSGQPFLAYLMTFAGHWPYPWLDKIYKKEVAVASSAKTEDLAMIERHLNINLYTSRLFAKTVQQLQTEDPTALIVLSGDHQPGFSGDLEAVPRTHDDVAELRFFKTPLLVIGPNTTHDEYASYEIGQTILDALGVSPDSQGQFHWFRRREGVGPYRPIPGGAILVSRQGTDPADLVCRGPSPEKECKDAITWFREARALGNDLAHGHAWATQGLATPR